jgi:peptide/nickel transport system substrate-binding protein
MAKDVRVREAFELAIDRDLINKVAFQGMYEPACGPMSPASAIAPGVKASQCPKRDVPKAKRLLKAAGVKGAVHVELKIPTTPEWSRIGQVIQAMVKDAGFALTLRPTEYATMLEETDNGQYQAFQSGWSGRLDPDGNIASFLQTKGAMNAYGLGNPEIDGLIKRGRTESDPAERDKIYAELIRKVNAEHTLIYLYRQKNYVVTGKDVAGLHVYGDGLVRVKDAGYVK